MMRAKNVHPVVWAAAALMVSASAFLVGRWALGESFASDYNAGEPRQDVLDVLLAVNIPEPHVASYDRGCVLYSQGDYAGAAEMFASALDNGLLVHPDECDVRVNLALSICNGLDIDRARSDEIYRAEAVAGLHEARDVLVEEGCAADDGSHHDGDAEQLKEDIDKLLAELEQQQPQDGSDDSGDESNSDGAGGRPDDGAGDGDGSDGGSSEDDIKDRLDEQEKGTKQDLKSRGRSDIPDAPSDGGDPEGSPSRVKPW